MSKKAKKTMKRSSGLKANERAANSLLKELVRAGKFSTAVTLAVEMKLRTGAVKELAKRLSTDDGYHDDFRRLVVAKLVPQKLVDKVFAKLLAGTNFKQVEEFAQAAGRRLGRRWYLRWYRWLFEHDIHGAVDFIRFERGDETRLDETLLVELARATLSFKHPGSEWWFSLAKDRPKLARFLVELVIDGARLYPLDPISFFESMMQLVSSDIIDSDLRTRMLILLQDRYYYSQATQLALRPVNRAMIVAYIDGLLNSGRDSQTCRKIFLAVKVCCKLLPDKVLSEVRNLAFRYSDEGGIDYLDSLNRKDLADHELRCLRNDAIKTCNWYRLRSLYGGKIPTDLVEGIVLLIANECGPQLAISEFLVAIKWLFSRRPTVKEFAIFREALLKPEPKSASSEKEGKKKRQ